MDLHTGSPDGQPYDQPEPVRAALIRAGLDQARDDGLRLGGTSPEVDEFLQDHRDEYGTLS